MPTTKEAANPSKARQSQMDLSLRSTINFDCLPILVLRRIMSYLDIGHIVPLTQVNRRLRYMLTEDNGYWLFLLHSRLNVKLTGKNRDTAFVEFVKRLPTLQCAECNRMELPRRPFIDPFWNRSLCDTCRIDDKYRVVYGQTQLLFERRRSSVPSNV
jgi:F-box domain